MPASLALRFKERYGIELSRQQERAAQVVDGATLLVAVPGSGKTTVLVARLGYLALERGTAPSLPDVPFHAHGLQHRRGGYEGLELETRKKLFAKFEGLVRRLPVTYRTFVYRRSEFRGAKALSERMQRDLSSFIRDNYPELQPYSTIAIYYDGGQVAANTAIHQAFDETLSANTADYKHLRYQERRLAQAADFFCSMELAALRYADQEEINTYIKLFGSNRAFKANYLKQMRRKLHP